MMILDQASNVQLFNPNHVVFFDDLIAQFMKEVLPLIRYFQMLAREAANCLASVGTAQLPFADLALCNPYRALRLLEQARILDDLAVAQGGEVLKSNIDAGRLAILWDEATVVFCNREDHKPTVRLSLDRASFDRAFNWAREAQAAGAYTAQYQLVTRQSKAALRVGKAIEKSLTLKARVSRLVTGFHATKESLERFAQTAQSVLQDLTMNTGDIFTKQFDFRELKGLPVKVDRRAAGLKGIAALLQASIVKLAAYIQGLLALICKRLVRLELEFVCLHLEPYFTQHFGDLQCLIASRR